MFSGIIEYKTQILGIAQGKFTIQNPFGEVLTKGQSIAHDGACMTIEQSDINTYSFFAMEESFAKTNFGHKKVGDFVNVERCIKVGSRLDGHFVSGHIDCTGSVKAIKKNKDSSKTIQISFPENFSQYIIEKGSIALNGVSLTIYNLEKNAFTVSLIPLTQKMTNLGNLEKNSIVNIEFDMLGKYILNTQNVRL